MAMFWKRIFDCAGSLLVAAACVGLVAPALAAPLNVKAVTDNVWMVQGAPEDFAGDNHGDISNSAFIATGRGVIVIDTGSTHAYGRQLRETITEYTDEPVRWVLNTHHHPDHVFGNSAFTGIPIMALQETHDALRRDGPVFLQTLQQRLGELATGTILTLPDKLIEPGIMNLDGYSLTLMAFTGHSGSDLVILDNQSGVLFAGDMVFWQRAPTTPHSPGVSIWMDELSQLASVDSAFIIPGHGSYSADDKPLQQTRAWLKWLDDLMLDGAANGLSANALIHAPLPALFAGLPLARYELTRTVSHFYRRYEDAWWEKAD